MTSKKADLHGQVPDNSKVVLLIIDMISDFEFENGEELFKQALPIARKIATLKKEAKKAKIPIIYINDNFGKWQENFERLLKNCLDKSVRGNKIVELLRPNSNDYYVLKPKHSAFYSTTLDLILKHLGTETLILTGISSDICVLFTANDAYMRDYKIIIPQDCVAAVKPKYNKDILKYVERVLKADIRSSNRINFDEII